MRKTLIGLSGIGILCLAAAVPAAANTFTVTFQQVGANVVAMGSGSIGLTGLTLASHGGVGMTAPVIWPSQAFIMIGPTLTTTWFDAYTGFTGPASYGSGAPNGATTGSGDGVGIAGSGAGVAGFNGEPLLFVPVDYVSGGDLSDSATYDNATLASLGVTLGTYTWTWDGGANSFVLQIGPQSAAEPGSFLLLAFVLMAGLWLGRKQILARAVLF